MIKSAENKIHDSILSITKFLLILLSIALISVNIYTIHTSRDLSRSYSEQQNEANWFLFQLAKEYTALLVATSDERLNFPTIKKSLMLHYELTWSRFDLIINSNSPEILVGTEAERQPFIDTFEKFKAMESLLVKIDNRESLNRFYHQAKILYDQTIQFMNQSVRLKSPMNEKRKMQSEWLTQIQYFVMMITFGSIGLVVYIFHRETRYHQNISLTDALTGLNNRLSMFHRLKQALKSTDFTVFLLDLNGFKAINDTHGHQDGDLVLQEVAQRLTNMKHPSHYRIFRIGGDEFAVILNSANQHEITKLNEEIHVCFSEKFTGLEAEYPLSTSVGHSRYPQDSTTISQLLHIADKNMYQMKRGEKSPL
jgi:diguanylate cyclase (GGDEF)-like protein